jgi:glycosyltransferase involved in cell wall biosynthesis
VLTPFHNTDAYLAECIESVLGQTYRNFEYILVDNQSKDRSAEIAKEYAKKDSRIRFFETSTLYSQSQNYNFALDQISPESRYIKIVQADDWVFPRCLTEMVDLAEANPSVGVVSSYELHERDVWCTGLHPSQKILSGRDACRLHLLDGVFLFGSHTTVMYRADLVRARKPFYPHGQPHPDTEAVFQLLQACDFGFVHQVLSYTRVHDDSISGRVASFQPQTLDRFVLVKRQGKLHLDANEYERCLGDATRAVYRSLASRWLRELVQERDENFWRHYTHGIQTAGESIRPGLLAKNVALVALKELLTLPLAAAQRLSSPSRVGRRSVH